MNLDFNKAQELLSQIVFELKQKGDITVESDDSNDIAYEIVSQLRQKGYFISSGLI